MPSLSDPLWREIDALALCLASRACRYLKPVTITQYWMYHENIPY